MTSLPVIILGAGGHARVLIDILKLRSIRIKGIVGPESNATCEETLGVPWIGDDNSVYEHAPDSVMLVNGIGGVSDLINLRRKLFESFKLKGYTFAEVIHPSSVIAEDVRLSEGVQVMAGAIIQPGSGIGLNTIINTRALVDHDCEIGEHVHIAPGCVLSGKVKTAARVHIGTGAIVVQSITIGEASVVGAGAVVIRNVTNDITVVGVPAEKIRR